MIDDLIARFERRKAKNRIVERTSIRLIESYIKAYKKTDKKTPEQLIVLKCLILSGDEMWLGGSYAEFHSSYRKWDVICNTGMCSYDVLMWHLLHQDILIYDCFKEVTGNA
ncbi:hypothetical protein POP12_116 [Pectobacterium phage POP12]|nr:hypothetical protein POP12_116 [Pectobacterium phage POP12]